MEVRRGSYVGADVGSGDSRAGWSLIALSYGPWHLHRLEQCPHAASLWVEKCDFDGSLRRGIWRCTEVVTRQLTADLETVWLLEAYLLNSVARGIFMDLSNMRMLPVGGAAGQWVEKSDFDGSLRNSIWRCTEVATGVDGGGYGGQPWNLE